MLRYFKEFFHVYCREFRITFRDQGIMIFFLFLPFGYPILYSLVYNPEIVRDVRMVVVDHDRTATSRELVREIDACQEAYVIGYAADLDEARRIMNDHKVYGILEIPAGFERHIGRQETANAVFYSDMSLMLRYRGFLVATTNVMQAMGAEILNERIDLVAPLAETIAVADPLPSHNVSLGNIESGFDSFIMPGIVILILHQCLILASAMAGGAKHEDPRMIGYNPVNLASSTAMTMAGQMMCYFTIIFVPAIFLYHYVPLIFRFPMAGDIWSEMLFLFPMMVGCLAIGFILQGVTRERETVFIFWVVTSVILLFLSGLTWPRFAMPEIWRIFGDLFPATYGVEGFIRLNTNGASLSQVSYEYYALWIQAGVYLIIAYCVQRWVMRPAILKTTEPAS